MTNLMQCPKCGSENPVKTQTCVSCGQVLTPGMVAPGAHGTALAGGGLVATAVPSPQSLQHSQQEHSRESWSDGQPERENTSGWGSGYPIPQAVQGWTFAGMAPFGLFALYNGMWGWGIAGLLLTAVVYPLYPVYMVIVGVTGREQAWRNRRFQDMVQYERTMQAWSFAGIILGLITLGCFVYWVYCFMQFILFAPTAAPAGPSCYS